MTPETKRWIRSEADERAAAEGYYFDSFAADHAVNFIESFVCHSRGELAGKPFTLLDWQRDAFIMPLFGWRRPG